MKKIPAILSNLTANDLIDACEIVYGELKPNMKHIREVVGAPEYCSLENVCRSTFFEPLRMGKDDTLKQDFIENVRRWESISKEYRKKGRVAPNAKYRVVLALSEVVAMLVTGWELIWKKEHRKVKA